MADPALLAFVEKSLLSGASKEETRQVLSDAGWSREQVTGALGAFSDIDFAVPVPRPQPQLSARDAFLYLTMFSMLYLSSYNLGSLLFQFIHLAYPDPLSTEYGDGVSANIRWSVSSLLIAFPLFLFVSFRIARNIATDPSQRISSVRKWLTYLTLSIAACILVGDLIVLLNSLLSGSLTMRFILKSLVVAIIAGAVFGYYLWSMREDDRALAQ